MLTLVTSFFLFFILLFVDRQGIHSERDLCDHVTKALFFFTTAMNFFICPRSRDSSLKEWQFEYGLLEVICNHKLLECSF